MTAIMLASRQMPWGRVALWTAFVSLDTATQVAFKWGSDALKGMDFGPEMVATVLSTPEAWLAALGYFATFLVWMLILQGTPLSRAFPMTGLAYVTVPLVAWTALGEAFDLARAIGIAFIVVGVIVLGRE